MARSYQLQSRQGLVMYLKVFKILSHISIPIPLNLLKECNNAPGTRLGLFENVIYEQLTGKQADLKTIH